MRKIMGIFLFLSILSFAEEPTSEGMLELKVKVSDVAGINAKSKVITLKNLRASEVEPFIRSRLSRYGTVQVSDELNMLIITDMEPKLTDLVNLVKELDRKGYRDFVRLKTEIVKLNYVVPSKIKGILEEHLSPDGSIKANDELNLLVITDLEGRIERIKKIIKEVDIPPQQVAIEVKILEIDADYAKKLGIDWASIPLVFPSLRISASGNLKEKVTESQSERYYYSDFSDTSLTERWEGNYRSVTTPGISIHGSAHIRPEMLAEVIEQSIHEGKGRIISSSRVVVQNNRAGTIWAGDRIYPAPRGARTGIMLSVTPHIGNEGMVALDINCEVSSLTGWDPQGNPLVSGREMRTTMMVKSGNTFVLGGLEKSAVIKSEKKIPILGSIPLLGYFFKKKVDAEIKKEVVIFITPTIVSSTQDMKQEMEEMMKE